MLNRKLAPQSAPILMPNLTDFTKETVCNNFDIFSLKDKANPIIKFKIICNVDYKAKHGVAILAAKMLRGGTNTKDATQIAQKLDYYGAYLNIGTDNDYAHITVTVLKRFYKDVLQIVLDTIENSIMPSSYFELQKTILKDKMALERRNHSYLALENLCENIYGQNHPYGKILHAKDVDNIKIEDIKGYYKNNIFSAVRVFIYGDFESSDAAMFENLKKQVSSSLPPTFIKTSTKNLKEVPELVLHMRDNIQDTVVFGDLWPKKDHKDFLGLVVLNELIGGYFGSRLMTNIREKLGYTYGIHSRIYAMQESTLFYVASDVSLGHGKEVFDKSVKEINDIALTPVGDSELSMLKNYMKGKLLMTMNDPFEKMNNLIQVYNFGLNKSYYENLYKTIDKITAKDIMELAQKYFTSTNFSRVFVTQQK